MKRVSIFFCLLLCLSALVSCGRSSSQAETSAVTTETPVLDLQNTTATRYYGCLSSDTLCFIDYNAEGKLLSVNKLDTNTLHANPLPKEKPTLQHTYNENGQLIGHIFSGAELTIRYDDRGYPLTAKGYNSSGTAYNVTYTCDNNGNILTETYTRGELPWAITNDIVYEYDADGRLLTYGDATLSYQDGILSTTITETYEDVTHVITCNDKGLPAAWLVNGEEISLGITTTTGVFFSVNP